MQIMVATDGSRQAQEAVNFGVMLARALEADFSMIGVAESKRHETGLRLELETVAAELGYDPSIVAVRSGQPASQILNAINERPVDLLIVGTRRRGLMGRLLLGDTAQRLARAVRIPMVIVRRSRPAIRRILVCTAGGEAGRKDVALAAEIAGKTGAQLTILHVMSQIATGFKAQAEHLGRSAAWHVEHETYEGQHLSELLDLAAEHQVECAPKLRSGLVVEEILAEAREGDYDLVVVGAHGGTGRYRFLLDDVTEEVISELNRPVLIVR